MLVLGREKRQGITIWKKRCFQQRVHIEVVSYDRKSVTLHVVGSPDFAIFTNRNVFEHIKPDIGGDNYYTIQLHQAVFLRHLDYPSDPFSVEFTFIALEPHITFAVGASHDFAIYRDELLEENYRGKSRTPYSNELEYF